MNEIAIEVAAREAHEKAIAYYKGAEQMLYKAIMEIKQIREERYYKQLGFDNFGDYCKNNWDCDRDYMNERITLADRYGEDFDGAHRQFGHTKMLLLSRMEPDQRQDFIESNPVDDMTTRELQAAIKEKKELERQLEAERNKPAQVVEKVVEKVPDDYFGLKRSVNELKADVTGKEESINQLQREKQLLEEKAKLNEQEAQKFNKLSNQIKSLTQQKDDLDRQISSAVELGGLVVEIEDFLKTKLSPVRYSRSLERLDSEVALKNLTDILGAVEKWCLEMRSLLPGTRCIEVVKYESVD